MLNEFDVQDVTGRHGRLEHRCWILRRIRVLRQRAVEKTDSVHEGCLMRTGRKESKTTQTAEKTEPSHLTHSGYNRFNPYISR